MVCEQILGKLSEFDTSGKTIEYVDIEWHEAFKKIHKKTTDHGTELGIRMDVGNLYSSDTFYDASNPSLKWADMGVLAIEMEAAALYCNAAYTKKRGLSLCSISDNILTGEELSPEARQTSFTAMMKIALETAVKMAAESQK